jgi:type II secretory pathway pseudopilin PulG
MWNKNMRGQTLIELIVVVTVAIIVITAIVFATISSIRNAQLSKNQLQATKFAQEGIEKVRSIRDRDGKVAFTSDGSVANKFSDLWSIPLSGCVDYCYFKLYKQDLDGDGQLDDYLVGESSSSFEDLGGIFKRQVQMTDYSALTSGVEKKLTVIVQWTDFSGTHESKLTTILGKI